MSSAGRMLYGLLFLYVVVAGTYQIIASASLIIEVFNLRNQVTEPFQIDQRRPVIVGLTEGAKGAGLSVGDTVQSVNEASYNGYALWQRIRWYAHPGDSVRVGVHKPNGRRSTATVPLIGSPRGASATTPPRQIKTGEAISLIFISIVVPFFCLVLGGWVALARPTDPNAWFILLLLTYPEVYISVGTYNVIPEWLGLRLAWHLIVEALTPGALLFLGLLFPERSRLDIRFPWLKWLFLAVLTAGLAVGLLTDYIAWYRLSVLPDAGSIDAIIDPALQWTSVCCSVLYWLMILDKLRTASSPDARRRLRVLLGGSVIGLGSLLIIWGLLPRLGIADPGEIPWLEYLSGVLMLFFPLTLAYVVIVQRAMDVRILLRMGTMYLLARTTILVLRWAGSAALVWFVAIPLIEHPHSRTTVLIWTSVLLAFALLFLTKKSPTDLLRHWIDRKFFREAYNAEVMLGQLAKTAQSISDPAALISTVAHQIADALHVEQIAVALRCNGSLEPAYSIGPPFLETGSMRLLGKAHSSAPVFTQNHDSTGSEGPELLLPLPGRTKLLGAMALGPKRSEEPYTPSDLRLLESVGVQTGLGLELNEMAASLAEAAIERAQAAREMEIAREVQERLFPQHLPVIKGVSLAGSCRTVFGVGGDYYDAMEMEDGRLGLAIGDVSGKGISAALLMASLRACLRTMTLTASSRLPDLMANMNRLIYEASAVNRYATFFFGIYDPAACRLRYVNAGHNPP
ncbi:MAG: SpoIIE family protein phosphatase, partial [Acidobacteriota bacterium]|nr:SpoIIE family protein phosphatase [Acidobacteriota bacterium]